MLNNLHKILHRITIFTMCFFVLLINSGSGLINADASESNYRHVYTKNDQGELVEVEVDETPMITSRSARSHGANISVMSGVYYTASSGAYRWYGNQGYITLDGDIAYCLDPTTAVYIGDGYVPQSFGSVIPDAKTQLLLARYAVYGYVYKGHNTAAYYNATQQLIWEALGYNVRWSTALDGGTTISYQNEVNEIKRLVNSHYDVPTFNTTNLELEIGEETAITDTKGVLANYSISASDGVTVRKNGNTLYIKVNKNMDSAQINFKKDISVCEQNIVYKLAGAQTIAPLGFIDPVTSNIKIKVLNTGDFELQKVNDAGQNVGSGFTFKIGKNLNGTLNDKENGYVLASTDSNGKIRLNEYKANTTLYYQEVSAPDNYILDNTVRSITIKAGQVNSVKASNIRTGDIALLKKDVESDSPIKGIEFKLSKNADMSTPIGTYKTDENGKIDIRYLAPDTYYMQESNTVSPYVIDRTIHRIVIKSGETTAITATNKKQKGQITVYKRDAETGEIPQGDATLEGWEYEITTLDGKRVEYIKVSSDHESSSATLPLNSYLVYERKCPTGYVLNPDPIQVNISYAGQEIAVNKKEVTIKDDVIKGKIKIYKMADSLTTEPLLRNFLKSPLLKSAILKPLKGIEFQVIHKKTGKIVTTLVTDERGYAEAELPYGWYEIKELPKEGYETLPPFNVFVDQDGVSKEYHIENTILKGRLKIVKRDQDTGNIIPLAGTSFKIRDTDTNKWVVQNIYYPVHILIDTFVTDSSGTVALPETMDYGNHYEVCEINAPNGYTLNNNCVPVSIDGSNADILVDIYDKPVKGKIIISKLGEQLINIETEETNYGTLFTPVFDFKLLGDVTYKIYADDDIIGKDGTFHYQKDDLIDTINTNYENSVESKLIPLGKLRIVETETANGYVIDKKEYHVELKYEGQEIPLIKVNQEYKNERQIAKVSFKKVLEESKYVNTEEALKKIEFGLFTAEDYYYNDEKVLNADSLVGITKLNDDLIGAFDIELDGKYYIKELSVNDQWVLDNKKYPVEFSYDKDNDKETSIILKEKISNTLKRGNINVVKIDEDSKKPIEGVIFDISDKEDMSNIIDTKITDSNGKIIFDQLEIHDYFIREHKKDGYITNDKIYKVDITSDNLIADLTVKNKPVYGQISFLKYGNVLVRADQHETDYGLQFKPIWNDQLVSGVELSIYADQDIVLNNELIYKKGELVETIISNEDKASLSKLLPVGKYHAIESACIDGLLINSVPHAITIKDDGLAKIQVVDLELHNDRAKVDLQVEKVLESDKHYYRDNAYKNVAFGIFSAADIYNYHGKKIIEKDALVTYSNINDHGDFENTIDLPYGDFYAMELSTDKDYKLDNKKYDFKITFIDENTPVIHVGINDNEPIVNSLKRTDVLVLKVDSLSKENLAGVKFKLYDSNKNLVSEGVTDKKGLKFENLCPSKYYLEESTPLAGYQPLGKMIEIDVQGEKNVTIKVENTKIPESPKTGVTTNQERYIFYGTMSLLAVLLIIHKKKMGGK